MPAQEALKKASITPVEFQLKAKDCLALLNGTTMFAGMACLNVHDAERLYKLSEITTALSLEAIRGETRAFDKRIQEARPYAGQIKAAANGMKLGEPISSSPSMKILTFTPRSSPNAFNAPE